MEELQGHVVLIYFWDYTNLGCIESLAYIKAWREKYRRLGLRMVGVHTPEFPFGRSAVAVRSAVSALGIKTPILLDGEFEVWNAYGNRTWPGFFVINTEGEIVYSDIGECAFDNIESVIQDLLRTEKNKRTLPELTDRVQPEDEAGLPMFDPTPTVLTGYEAESIGNEEGFEPHRVVSYEVRPKKMEEGRFYLHGKWLNHRFSVAVAKAHDGPEASIEIPYTAKEVNVVIHPQGDLGFSVNLELNGQPLSKANCGENVRLTGRGASRTSVLVVSETKMYRIVNHDKMQTGVLKMSSRSGGLAIYSFSFKGSTERDGEKIKPPVKALLNNKAKAKKSIVALSKVFVKEAEEAEKAQKAEEKKLKAAEKKAKKDADKKEKAAAAKGKGSKAEASEEKPAKKGRGKAKEGTEKVTAKKSASKKADTKKTAKKAEPKKAVKKAEEKKATAKKAAPKKESAKKADDKKKAATKKKAPAKKKVEEKKPTKKAAEKKASAKKETAAKKAPSKKKTAEKKASPKKAAEKKASPKKVAEKKTAAKKGATAKKAASKKKSAATKSPAKNTKNKGIKAENADDSAREVLRTRAGKKPARKKKTKK